MDIFDRLKAAAAADWQSYVDHYFVRQLGAGTLPHAAFRTYLVQDYLFLIQFARAYALATYKSRTLADMRAAQAGLAAILDEMDLHVRLCGRWGLSPEDIEADTAKMKAKSPVEEPEITRDDDPFERTSRLRIQDLARPTTCSTFMSRWPLASSAMPRSAAT